MKWFMLMLMVMQLSGASLNALTEQDLRARSAKDDLPASVELARRQLSGEIMPSDQKFVLDAFRRGSEAGIASAHTGLANCYKWSVGMDYYCMPEEEKPIRPLLEKATEMGDPEGTYFLGRFYMDTKFRHGTRSRALELINKAISMGSVDAEAYLAVCILDGYNIEQDTEEGLSRLKALLEEKDNVYAAAYLGSYYQNTLRDFATAEKYLLIAAEKNHAGAMVKLGDMIEKSKKGELETAKKTSQADWYRKAIQRNSAEAMRRLGQLQVRSLSGRKNGEDWYQLWLDADRKGDSIATLKLAEIHYHAPGYTYRDLDWSKSAAFYDKFFKRFPKPNVDGYGALWNALDIHYNGGHGQKRNYRKCLEIAQPYLNYNAWAAAYAGRILLHPDAPLGNSRELFIRGYACILKSRAVWKRNDNELYEITDDALFMFRSRHRLTQDEVKKAEDLLEEGYPNPSTPILP